MGSSVARRRRAAMLSTALALGLCVSACGGSGASDSNGSGRGSSATGLVAEAKAKVTELSTTSPDDKWPMPTGDFDPGTGKMTIISCGEQGVQCHDSSVFLAQVGRAAGWAVDPIWDGKFSPSEQSAGVLKAVQSGSKIIILAGGDLDSIKGAVQTALDKGVVFSCSFCNPGSFEGKVINATYDLPKSGEAVAWDMLARAKGPVKVLAFNDTAFPQVTQKFSGLKRLLEEKCSDCSFKEVPIPTGDLVKPGPPTFTAAMSSNPKGTVTDVLAPYDLFATQMGKTLLQLNRPEIRVSGSEVTKEAAQGLADGSLPLGASTSVPFEYWAWLSVDASLRKVAGAPKWNPGPAPFILVTSANAKQFISKYYAPGFDFKSQFRAMWK